MIKRLHDKLYLNSNRYSKPKESSKLLLNLIKKQIDTNKKIRILDLGCANGELLFFLKEKFNKKKIVFEGYDIRQDLLNKAKLKLKDVILKKVDITKKINFNSKFDIIICSGVISIFDDLRIFFLNLKKLSKKDTIIYFFGNFNENNFNVFIKYQDIKKNEKIIQSGWNIWSIDYLRNKLKDKKLKKHQFFIDIDVKKQKKDLIRTWTIKIDKKRYFTNALGLFCHQYWLEFS